MKYEYNGKTYNIKDSEIDTIMEKIEDISIAEACEMWLFDNDKIENEKVDEMTAKVAKSGVLSTIHGAKGEKKARKAREKKENPLKKEIIAKIYSALKDFDDVTIKNDEKYIDFTVNGLEFTVNLVQHRQKK